MTDSTIDIDALFKQLEILMPEIGTDHRAAVRRIGTLEGQVSAIDLSSLINDGANATISNKAYSAQKIHNLISDKLAELKNELLNGAGDAFNTLKELQDLITNNQDTVDVINAAIASHVRFDMAQNLTDGQQETVRQNIGAAALSDIGEPVDVVTLYRNRRDGVS